MIIIIRQTTTPTLPGETPTIAVQIAITDNGNWREWGVGGIPADTLDVQAYLNAQEAALRADAIAGNAPIVPSWKVEAYKIYTRQDYIEALWWQRRQELSSPTTLIDALNHLIAKLDDNAEEYALFNAYRVAEGLAGDISPTGINAMSVANRQLLLRLITDQINDLVAALARISASELFD